MGTKENETINLTARLPTKEFSFVSVESFHAVPFNFFRKAIILLSPNDVSKCSDIKGNFYRKGIFETTTTFEAYIDREIRAEILRTDLTSNYRISSGDLIKMQTFQKKNGLTS